MNEKKVIEKKIQPLFRISFLITYQKLIWCAAFQKGSNPKMKQRKGD